MTGRTHDLAAATTLTCFIALQPLESITLATAVTALSFNLIGAAAPDLDQPTGKLWKKIPAGTLWGRLLNPFFGAHRSISHSFLGVGIFGFIAWKVLEYMSSFLIVDIQKVWLAFMLGLISHLIADLFTKNGLPLLFPHPYKFGIPPVRRLRITTGKIIETSIIFPALLLFNIYVIYQNYEKFLDFFKNYIIR